MKKENQDKQLENPEIYQIERECTLRVCASPLSGDQEMRLKIRLKCINTNCL